MKIELLEKFPLYSIHSRGKYVIGGVGRHHDKDVWQEKKSGPGKRGDLKHVPIPPPHSLSLKLSLTCLTASALATAPQGPSMSALIPSRVATSCSAVGRLEGEL